MPKLVPDGEDLLAPKEVGPAVRLALGADIVKTVGDKALTPPFVRLSVTNDGMPSKQDRYPEALTPPSVRLALSNGQAERNGTLEGPSVRPVAPNAGVDQQGSRTLQEDLSTRPALLVSFWYLEAFLSNRPRYHYRDWVMDSGAFSAYNSGAVINLQEYVECCKRLMTEDPTLTEIFALDVIGDWKGTKANTERMWEQGVPAIPCFHYGEPWDVLKGYCKDYPKVAIGGCVGRRDKDKFAGQCFARTWPKKLHGFGFGTEKSIMLYPWHSTDATNWEVGPCKYGTWKAFGRQRVSVRGSKQNLRAEVEWYLDLERRAQERWRKEMKLLDGLWPAVRLAINGQGQGEVNGALTRPNSVRLVVGTGRSVKDEELTKALGNPKSRK